jgi:hypothetical protein
MLYDDGRNDKSFDIDERRLRWSQDNLRLATEKLLRASQTLHDLVLAGQEETETRH